MIIINTDYRKFQAEVIYKLKLRNWDYQKLADATGYKLSTIRAFLAANSGKKTKGVAYKIARVLDIKEELVICQEVKIESADSL